jgi:hypothetical protein
MTVPLVIRHALIIGLSVGAPRSGTAANRSPSELLHAVDHAEKGLADLEIMAFHACSRPGAGGILVTESSIEQFITSGDHLFWREDSVNCAPAYDRSPPFHARMLAWDGAATREAHICDKDVGTAFARRMDGPSDSLARVRSRLLRPHMLLVHSIANSRSLGDFIRRSKTIRLLQDAAVVPINGLSCVGLEFEVDKGLVVHVWLAQERSLIPAKVEVYERDATETNPTLIGVCGQWTMIDGHVMVPRRARITRFGSPPGRVDEVEDWSIDRAVASPNFPPEFFRTLAVPRGMVVESEPVVTHRGGGALVSRMAVWSELSTPERFLLVNSVLMLSYLLRLAWGAAKGRALSRS